MRAIVLMFDSLNRHFLPAYGARGLDLPNFERLAARATTMSRCYAGSMPCMPARRELHTGRYNFLHRGWGPLEPFDDSVPEILKKSGVYTHLVTDHQHYWEDGGATYHSRYSSFEFFRGQEGDPWKGQVADPEIPETLSWRTGEVWRQDWINRRHFEKTGLSSQTQTVDAGLEFIDTNRADDNWLLQIECFDPHEPFVSSPEHRKRVGDNYGGSHFDWPDYRPVLEDENTLDHIRKGYSALLTMCDDSLGRILDRMDAYRMWEDTVLIVCTDHGFLLGEHEWYGKNVQPWYEENIHTPLFICDPLAKRAGQAHSGLVQTIDLAATFLDIFGLEPTGDMQGRSILPLIREETQAIRKTALFGIFGGHVSITDGRYVYMRAAADPSNRPLEEYTLMPTRMKNRYSVADLAETELVPAFSFTKGLRTLRTRGLAFGNPFHFGSLLYDLESDPGQKSPIDDPDLELRMAGLLVAMMRENDAPESQYVRLGLPMTGAVGPEHLLVEKQWPQVMASLDRDWRAAPRQTFGPAAELTLTDIFANAEMRARVGEAFGAQLLNGLVGRFGHLSLWHISVMSPAMTPDTLRVLDAELARSVSTPARQHWSASSKSGNGFAVRTRDETTT
ncbi:sulfatase [Pelagibacterium halotolerans]|uniref:Choline-sulfatase n=1 Tax=Pelagibacterium halotolerans (strain DSM 22347 / JCM 15775 / CGMCC 1.7692 / B2) TaxID=1082931 RepID=G4R7E3_PELHB|nr:sulfatase [Pelagibacterium halotolerans]AEQ51281.1 choline-sulfatase [Pelagibacterium halotolerans B2]QJR18863.1 sulfatase [Pelagibacterium halotolerans]SEA66557.1 Arylsulfatase A [Pelagibacterium halotolerans]